MSKVTNNKSLGSISGKLPTCPSPKPTITLTSHSAQNVGFGDGRWARAVSQKTQLEVFSFELSYGIRSWRLHKALRGRTIYQSITTGRIGISFRSNGFWDCLGGPTSSSDDWIVIGWHPAHCSRASQLGPRPSQLETTCSRLLFGRPMMVMMTMMMMMNGWILVSNGNR